MKWSNQVEKNLEAIEYEKNGLIEKAITLYEENVSEEFNGTHPYKRLVEIYLELSRTEDLIRVLEKAMDVFAGAEFGDCKDKYVQLKRFKMIYMNITKKVTA